MEKSVLNFKEVGFIAQSKNEIYHTLVTEGKLFIRPIKEKSMLFISQLAVGKKKELLCLYISHYSPFEGAQNSECKNMCATIYQRSPL